MASLRSDSACRVQLETVLLVLTVPCCLYISMEAEGCRVGDGRLDQFVSVPATNKHGRVTHTQVPSLDQAIGKQVSVII